LSIQKVNKIIQIDAGLPFAINVINADIVHNELNKHTFHQKYQTQQEMGKDALV
jgi:hypothetical protein